MPSQERFRARPIWACLEPCPVSKITSFGLDSSRSRKFVTDFDSYIVFIPNETNSTPPPHPLARKSFPPFARCAGAGRQAALLMVSATAMPRMLKPVFHGYELGSGVVCEPLSQPLNKQMQCEAWASRTLTWAARHP